MKKIYFLIIILFVGGLQLSAQTVDKILCSGESFTINSTAYPSAASTYQWLENGQVIAGATAADYTIAAGKAAGVYTYIRQSKSATCVDWQNSNAYTVAKTVNAPPTASVADLSINCGDVATMSATVSGGTTTAMTYTWYLGGVSQGTTTTSNKATSALTATTNYYVTVTNSNGCMVTSGSANITVGSCVPPEYVTLAGLNWATTNVNTYQSFAANIWDFGMFYQWNQATAWSPTDPGAGIAIPGWPAANTSPTWTVNPCPAGWRLPTKDEWVSLHNLGYYDATVTNFGKWYGKSSGCDMNSCIFLPAVGDRVIYEGTLYVQGSFGYYWSSTQFNSTNGYGLHFYSISSYPDNNVSKAFGLSVRCVK